MEDIAEQVIKKQCLSIEFEKRSTFRLMAARYWKGNELCQIFVCRSSLTSTDLTGELGSLARLLSVISTQVDIVACSGIPVGLIQASTTLPTSLEGSSIASGLTAWISLP